MKTICKTTLFVLSCLALLTLQLSSSEARRRKPLQQSDVAKSQNRFTDGRFAPGRGLTPTEHRSLQAKMQNRRPNGTFTRGYRSFPWTKVTSLAKGDVLTHWGDYITLKNVKRKGDRVHLTYRDNKSGRLLTHKYKATDELLARKAGKGATGVKQPDQEIILLKQGWSRKKPQTIQPGYPRARKRTTLSSLAVERTAGGVVLVNREKKPVSATFSHVFVDTSTRLLVGKRGAKSYVLDPKSGRTITSGHHRIKSIGPGTYEGQLGARSEMLKSVSAGMMVKKNARLDGVPLLNLWPSVGGYGRR